MMFRWIKHFFCKHEWEICRKIEPFASLRGEQLYRSAENVEKLSRIFTGSSMEVGISDGH